MSQFTLLDVPGCFTKAQTEMSGLYASFESIRTSSLKKKKEKKNHLIQHEFLFNILECKDLLFHAYLFPGSETMNKPPG